MIEHLLHASPVSSAGIDLICAALGEIAARWPEGRTLRVLEIGADGGMTRRVLDRLAQSGAAFRYAATATDAEQVARLGSVVSATPEASAACWAPSEGADALGDGRFDLILAAHACARLRLDTQAFTALRDLLAPGGLLIAVEPDPNPLWDLVFGRAPEWWRGADAGAGGSPLRSGEDWRVELAVAGFDAPGAAAVAGGPWPNSVFWGRAPTDLQPEAEGAAPLPIALIVDRSGRQPRFAQAARVRRAPRQRDRSGRVCRQRPRAGRGFERRRGSCRDRGTRGRGGRRSDRAGGVSARHVAAPCGGRGAPTDAAVGCHKRRAADRAQRCLRRRSRRRRTAALSEPPSGASRGCCSTRPRVCRCGSSISPRGWTGPSAGARWSRSWRPRPRKPRSSGPGRAAMYRGCVAVCRRAGRLRAMRWRSTAGPQSGIDALQWRPAASAPAGTGRGFDRRPCRRAQFPRRDVGDGAAARGGADRRLRRPDIRPRMRRNRPRGRGRGRGAGGRRPGSRLRARLARDTRDDRGARGDPHPGRDELRGGGDDAGDLRHRDLCARHSGQSLRRASSC